LARLAAVHVKYDDASLAGKTFASLAGTVFWHIYWFGFAKRQAHKIGDTNVSSDSSKYVPTVWVIDYSDCT
jgi:hypothetical protein